MIKMLKGLLVTALVVGALMVGTWADSYTIEAECISATDGIIYFEDTYNGEGWIWEAEEGETFTVGNLYNITIHKGHLQSYEDDTIKRIKEVK